MSTYEPKDSRVKARALEVQRLVIPLAITHNATPASKVLANDEPAVLFLKTQGLTQITIASGALDAGEATPTFDSAAADSTGTFNMLVRINEAVSKIMAAQVIDRATGAAYPCFINSTPLDANGTKLLLNCTTSVSLATTDLNACLMVEYVVS